jgi:hypothetical protein
LPLNSNAVRGGPGSIHVDKHQRTWAHAAVGLTTQWYHRELGQIQSFAHLAEHLLEREHSEFKAWLQAQDTGLEATGDQDFFDVYLDDVNQLSETLPSIARGALVVATFSLFESFVARLARVAAQWSGLSSGARKLRGLEDHLEFLRRIPSVRLPSDSSTWSDMRLIEKVRHRLVHAEGRISEDDTVLRPLLEAVGLSVNHRDQVVLTRAPIPWIAETLGELGNQLDSTLRTAIEASA